MSLFNFFKRKNKSPYSQIINRLKSDLLAAKFENDWKLCQNINVKLSWLELVKTQNEIWKNSLPQGVFNDDHTIDVSKLGIEDITFPSKFNHEDVMHHKFAEKIVTGYGDILSEKGKYSNSLYKPASLLPYPIEIIERAINFLLFSLSQESQMFKYSFDKAEMIKNLNGSKSFLIFFVNADINELPHEMSENIRVGTELSKLK